MTIDKNRYMSQDQPMQAPIALETDEGARNRLAVDNMGVGKGHGRLEN